MAISYGGVIHSSFDCPSVTYLQLEASIAMMIAVGQDDSMLLNYVDRSLWCPLLPSLTPCHDGDVSRTPENPG